MRQIVKGSTTISVDIYIIDSTDGTPETGVVFNTSGIDLEYRRDGEVAVNITEADLTTPALTDAWADGGFLHIGHGLYRLDVPDAAFATGAGESTVSIQGTVTGMIVLPQTIQLIEGFVVAGTDGVPDVNLTHIIDGAVPTQGVTGVLEVDLTHINAAAQTATLDDIEAQTDDIGVAGAGLTDLGGMSTGMKAEVQAEVVDALKEMGLVLSSSTIETVTNQTNFIIPATADATDNDAYNDLTAVFIDGTDANQRSVRSVINYTASTRSIQVDSAPDFTVTTSDTIVLLSSSNARAVWNRVLTGSTHNETNSAGRRLRRFQEAGFYSDGAIWIDTSANGAAGTTDFENGTFNNPVDNIADANTLATSVGLNRFIVAPGSSITFAASQENQEFTGKNWTLALGGQSVSNSHIIGADISGTGTSSTEVHFDHCEMGDCTLGSCHIDQCDMEGDITLSAAANYFILGCFHTSGTTPLIDFGSGVANTTVHIHDYHGAIQISNMGQSSSTDVLHFSSPDGKLTLNSNNIAGGTVNLNGVFDLVDNAPNITVNKDGLVNVDLIWDELMVASTGAPAITGTMRAFMEWWATLSRNVVNQTATTTTVRNDADDGDISTSTVSDDGTTFVRGEFST